ncbi:response regulator [Massilia sp. YIM B02769]|uniref:response regulator transcription factor n=1 Tax=Massilia sp. YIM B02769 TaxID=3050129 RepID=UPI0025B6C1A2|nr:response regulator [Massilia sp. YIM B02769]MDN4059006.1 response regulator [Massilia sp. YIM B02769]
MKRILLAEDDPAVSYILARYLDKAGFAVRAAPDGRAALALFDAEPADLLVTDFRMPGMNGEELILALRGRQPDLPALIVSAYGNELSVQIPGVRVLNKPVAAEELVALVNDLLLNAATMALNRPSAPE